MSASKTCIFLTVFIAVLAYGIPAFACSYMPCGDSTPDAYLPNDTMTVPANLAGVFVRTTAGATVEHDELQLEITPLDDEGDEGERLSAGDFEVSHGLELTFDMPLEENQTYRIDGEHSCEATGASSFEFETTAAAPIPEDLGTIEIGESSERTVQLSSSLCQSDYDAVAAEVRLQPSEEVEAWEDLIWYRTYVDGEVWDPAGAVGEPSQRAPGHSWTGHGTDLIFSGCGNDRGLSEGAHEVEIHAFLPGVDEPIKSETATVELECGEGAFDDQTDEDADQKQKSGPSSIFCPQWLPWCQKSPSAKPEPRRSE